MGLTAGNEDYSDEEIDAVAPWPALSVAEFQRDYSIKSQHDVQAIISHLLLAQIYVGRKLVAAANEIQAEAPEEMDEVNLLYIRAVSAKAKAMLLPEHISFARRETAENEGEESEETQEFFITAMREAIDTIHKIVFTDEDTKAKAASTSVHLI